MNQSNVNVGESADMEELRKELTNNLRDKETYFYQKTMLENEVEKYQETTYKLNEQIKDQSQ